MEDFKQIPPEKFKLVNENIAISDKKFDTKPIGYFHDAMRRFCKSKAAVVAFVIIVAIVLFSIIAPLCTKHDAQFLEAHYSKMGPRNTVLSKMGIATGTETRELNERVLMNMIGIGIGAEDVDGNGNVTSVHAMDSQYQPLKKIKSSSMMNGRTVYKAKVETYLAVGFMYMQVSQGEYQNLVNWQKETGKHLLYPLVENNKYCQDNDNANYWYKATTAQLIPVKTTEDGKEIQIAYNNGDFVLEDNYKRNADGELVYYEYYGGGSSQEIAEYKVRVLFYNYYQYKNGFEPQYIFGTDSQGYDLALRLAGGIQFSLLIALAVSVLNLVIGAIYGAIEGYYGGVLDLLMERFSDILSGIPFMVLATLFQLHFAAKAGPIVSLIFAFVITGWIGMASLVRTQFYRFKNQEYVLAARTLGAKDRRIIWKHIFPNSLGTIVTSCALVIPSVIFSESMLSFLGIVNLGGAKITSLGTLLSDASTLWTQYPHLMLFPAIIISLLMICFNLFGNGLRDAFNPSLRGAEG